MRSAKFLPIVAIVFVLPMLFGCPSKNNPTPNGPDQQLTKLSKSWKCTSATLDNTPQTAANNADYSAFVLTLSGTAGQTTFNYSCAGRPKPLSPWPASGTFTFGTDFATSVTRTEDNIPVTYSVTDSQLQITFNYSGAGYAGRVDNVKGNWVFTFAPQ